MEDEEEGVLEAKDYRNMTLSPAVKVPREGEEAATETRAGGESGQGQETVEIKEERKLKKHTLRAPRKNLKPPKVSFMDCSYWQK